MTMHSLSGRAFIVSPLLKGTVTHSHLRSTYVVPGRCTDSYKVVSQPSSAGAEAMLTRIWGLLRQSPFGHPGKPMPLADVLFLSSVT